MFHFKDILQEPPQNRLQAINKITTCIPKIVTNDHNEVFMWRINFEEVEFVVKEMQKNKAPCPYGFTLEFFKGCWNFLGEEVYEVVEESSKSQKI